MLFALYFLALGCNKNGTEEEKVEYVHFLDGNFKAYCVRNFDSDGDGGISIEEAGKVKTIDCSNSDIRFLSGIQYFSSIEKLNCSGNQLTSLDVSKNTALNYLACFNNQISTIYVWEEFDPSKFGLINKDPSASFEVKQ